MTETLPAERKTYSPEDRALIKSMVARDLSEKEFEFLIYLAQTYRLDPFLGEVWAVKYGTGPARVFTGKNGFLKVAHDSGQLDGIEIGWRKEGEDVIGWARVRRKDAANPFYEEVLLSEYKRTYKENVPTEHRIWEQKPITMIQKVALVHALRLAFPIGGLYAPEEFGEAEKPPMKDVTPEEDGVKGPRGVITSASSTPGQIIDADARLATHGAGAQPTEAAQPAKKKRQVKIGGKWVDEDKADLFGKG